MASKKKPKFDRVVRGLRVRVYATRDSYEVIFGDDADIADPEAYVMVYPKIGDGSAWLDQGRLDYTAADDPHAHTNQAAIDLWTKENQS